VSTKEFPKNLGMVGFYSINFERFSWSTSRIDVFPDFSGDDSDARRVVTSYTSIGDSNKYWYT
jgi:hypothetical protein